MNDGIGWLIALFALIFAAGMLANRPHITNTVAPTITANATASGGGNGGGVPILGLLGLLIVALIGLAALGAVEGAADAVIQQSETERVPVAVPTVASTVAPIAVPVEQPTTVSTVEPAVAPTVAPIVLRPLHFSNRSPCRRRTTRRSSWRRRYCAPHN